MLLPTKHTNISQSLLGFGGYILTKLNTKNIMSIDILWEEYQGDYLNKIYVAKHSFDNLILTLVFLHSIGAIEEKNGGVLICD